MCGMISNGMAVLPTGGNRSVRAGGLSWRGENLRRVPYAAGLTSEEILFPRACSATMRSKRAYPNGVRLG
jgi:hypothetical protein